MCLYLDVFADGKTESFETGDQDPFQGSSSLVWIGDIADFKITSAGWPVNPAPDFSGSNSIRAQSNQALNSTILTDISDTYSSNLKMRWEVFISGRSTGVTSTRGFSLILFVNSQNTDDIENGNVNGYRIHVYDPSGRSHADGLYFEKANGTGWEIIDYVETPTDIKLNQGWNIVVERDAQGNWSWGYSNGLYNTSISLTRNTTDNDYTSGTYSGMYWYSIASYSNSFGFDNFKVDPYTPNLWSENAISSEWVNTSNWDDNTVPNSTENITIESGEKQPIVTANINCGNLTLKPNSVFEISDGATVNVNGNFTLESDLTGTASLLDYGNLIVSGDKKIQCYLKCNDPTVNNEFHFLSSPIAKHPIENTLMNYYVYPYDEITNSWSALKVGDSLKTGQGYSVYYSGNSDQIAEFNGDFNSGDQSIPVTATNYSGINSDDNWNLIGNPFPSAIDWDFVTKDNIESAIYIWDAERASYSSYVSGVGTNFNNDGIIPPTQGFFVHATSSGNLIIPQLARVGTHSQLLKSKQLVFPKLKIQLADEFNNDECIICIRTEATQQWDSKYDALKILSFKSDIPQIYSVAGDKKLSINSLKMFKDTLEIPLVIITNNDLIHLSFNSISEFSDSIKVNLKDKELNRIMEINKDSCYQFNQNNNDIHRFSILFVKKNPMPNSFSNDYGILINTENNLVNVKNIPNEFRNGVLELYSIDGRLIKSLKINKRTHLNFSIMNNGIYILMIKSFNKVFTHKICIIC
jgi:hypothetical protein